MTNAFTLRWKKYKKNLTTSLLVNKNSEPVLQILKFTWQTLTCVSPHCIPSPVCFWDEEQQKKRHFALPFFHGSSDGKTLCFFFILFSNKIDFVVIKNAQNTNLTGAMLNSGYLTTPEVLIKTKPSWPLKHPSRYVCL